MQRPDQNPIIMLLSQLASVQAQGATVLSDLLDKSQFLRLAQFREDGTDYVKHPAQKRDEPGFRAKSGDYGTPENDNPTISLGELKFLGKEAILEKSYKIDAQKGLMNLDLYKRRLLKRHGYAMARGIDKMTFAGDGTGNNILGFSELLDGTTNVPGFTDTMVQDAPDGSLDLTDSTNWPAFLEILDELQADVPNATMLAANGSLVAKLNTIGRDKSSVGEGRDAFGRPYATYNGIPIARLNDGAITNTEPSGEGTPTNDTTSLYVIRFEEVDGTCLPSNSGFQFTDFPELEASVNEKARMELYYDIDIEAPDAIRRLRYLKV